MQDDKKGGISSFLKICPVRHILVILSALIILLHLLTRSGRLQMIWISNHVIRPIHKTLSVWTSHVPFSVAELLIALLVILAIVYLILQIVSLIRKPERLKRLYRTLISFVTAGLMIYAGFCMLWGVYYYGDDFITVSGLKNEKVSVEELAEVTEYFADMANEYSSKVTRDAGGIYSVDYKAVLSRSDEVYGKIEKDHPCLEGPEVKAKGVICSRIMSYVDFTGFFFPFTAEANVNTETPSAYFASTVAHELAHQRGVAKEQEANFVAVLASLEYGDPDYVYSAAVLAYTHLGNALYDADNESWKEIYSGLNEKVLTDLKANREYWQRFETPVQKASNTVYESFLYSYDQDLGLKSYGACVDLLVNYYYEAAKAANNP
ncbi:MAG: DUF3810 domain-containing protein [Oscillospiraceae bacterium]|nr:DUF3810 domain-containing protein [Oscillospiraceae bacterium]